MVFFKTRAAVLAAGALLALSACNGSGAVPSNATGASASSGAASVVPADTTSILKLLTKDVVIGSTIDPTNGDTGPRAISQATTNYGKLKKGDLLVCNFDDSAGNAGKGTTIELFPPKAGSKPTTFVQSSTIEGCDGDAITTGDQVYPSALTANDLEYFNQSGKAKKTYKSPIDEPLGDGDAPPLYLYSPEYIFIGSAGNGTVEDLSLGGYGTKKLIEVINGFPINKGTGWGVEGPAGFAYNSSKKVDTLYVTDGACNAVVAIVHASNLLVKDEITVGSGCKTFKCKDQKATCGKLVLSGSPLNAPQAEAILPNGNLIVANTAGGNTLVELTPTGQVLDTKVVDTSGNQGIYGLWASGTADSNTVLYYTDTNDNSLHELQQ